MREGSPNRGDGDRDDGLDVSRPAPRPPLIRSVWILIVLGALVVLVELALGVAGSQAFVYLAVALGLGIVSSLAWKFVERRQERGGFGIWLAFPIALLAAFAVIPLLAFAVWPGLDVQLRPADRVEAYYLERPGGRRLEVWFPQPMQRDGNNLRLNATPVPPRYYASHPDYFRWIDRQTLSIAVDEVRRDLDLVAEVEHVAVNLDVNVALRQEGAMLFAYVEGGTRVPGQRVAVRR
jgi:hypothetical protein